MMECRHNCNLAGKMAYNKNKGSDGDIQGGNALTMNPADAELTDGTGKKLFRPYKERSPWVVKNVDMSTEKQPTDWSTPEQSSSLDTNMTTSSDEVKPPRYSDISVHGNQNISGKITEFLKWGAGGSDLKDEFENNKDTNKSLNSSKSQHRLHSGQNEYGYEFHRHKFSNIPFKAQQLIRRVQTFFSECMFPSLKNFKLKPIDQFTSDYSDGESTST